MSLLRNGMHQRTSIQQSDDSHIMSNASSAPSIYIAGHRGMVGAALVRALERAGHSRLIIRKRLEKAGKGARLELFYVDS